MNRKHRKKKIGILIAALLVTGVIGMAGVFAPNLPAPAQQALGVLATPFRAAAGFVSDKIADIGDYFADQQALRQRVAELEAQVAELSRESREAQAALEENERLRELLELRQKRSDFTFLSTRVTGRTGSGWASELTINAGASDGVETGMCVVTEYGDLVGVVIETGPNYAVVRTLLDPNSALGAMTATGGDSGVLKGGLDELSQGLCRLSYLSSEAVVAVGDTVVTSELGGLYPSGLVLGTVAEVGEDPSGMERYALVAPAAEVDRVSQVFVITAFDVVE